MMYMLQECITGEDKRGAALCLESVLLHAAFGLVGGFIYLLYKILAGQGKKKDEI